MDIRKYFLPPYHHPLSPFDTRFEVFHNRYRYWSYLDKSNRYRRLLQILSNSLHDLDTDSDKTTTEGSSQATSSRDLLCEPGWLNTGVINLGCLYFKSEMMNHAEARKYCQDNSSHLVEVQNQHQLDFIRIRAINENYFVTAGPSPCSKCSYSKEFIKTR